VVAWDHRHGCDRIVRSGKSPVEPDRATFDRKTHNSAAAGAPALTGSATVRSLLRAESVYCV
jgi:hypothetical protein